MTNVVENNHAVSRPKHETFPGQEYSLGCIAKETLKGQQYGQHSIRQNPGYINLLCEISTISMDMNMMVNPSKGVCMDAEIAAMKAWVELFRPVKQVTVRQQSTKDKTGIVPIILYKNEEPHILSW